MFIDFESSQGEWFQFFGSHIDLTTGDVVYEDPTGDARVQIRSMGPFIEERAAKRKKKVEHVYNPKTRIMDRVIFTEELSAEAAREERDDLWDWVITDIENFKNKKTGEIITCTRENKLALMKVPVFDRFVARCQQILSASGIKAKEESTKN